jgi:hypothetical protein
MLVDKIHFELLISIRTVVFYILVLEDVRMDAAVSENHI